MHNHDHGNNTNNVPGFVSTSTTTINSTFYKTSMTFRKEKNGMILDNSVFRKQFVDIFPKDEPGLVDLISDQPKVLIPMTTSYFHLYHDIMGEFLAQYEITPDAKFLIDITHIENIKPLPEFIKMFFKFLNDNKVDYRPINLNKFNKFNINNLYHRRPELESLEINDPSNRIRNMAQRYIKDKETKPFRKVFLSRKNFQGRDLSVLIKGRLPYENDDRLDDEEMLQDYFKQMGIEVVVPEDFKTFEEQMNFFDKVDLLISTTSSGFTNAAFMRPGGTMVELTTPLISFSRIGDGVTSPISQGQEEIHHFYHMMSIALGHKFISIPNKERSAKKIIEIIESDSVLKYILSSKEVM